MVIILMLFMSALIAMPNFQSIKNTRQKKQAFFNYLKPHVTSLNQAILKDRHHILDLQSKKQKQGDLSEPDKDWLQHIAKTYEISNFKIANQSKWHELLERVDEVPMSMVLAQAANESAWGTSRFAKQANNLFGQWCFKAGCGIVPKQRSKGMHHEVRKFTNASDAIKQYMVNLNTNRNYQLFRQLRMTQRKNDKTIDGYLLAKGLIHYSERKEQYVQSIRAIIKQNHLNQYDIA